MAGNLEALVQRLEAVTGRLESVASRGGGGGGAAAGDDDPIWYDDYKTFHTENLEPFAKASGDLGGDMTKAGELLSNAFNAHKDLITIAARNNRPSAADLPTLLKPLAKAIGDIQEYRENSRGKPQFNHLSALSEGIPFLGWVSISPKPALHIGQMEESAQFYTNKILKEFKESDPKQADWARSFVKLLKNTQAHVKDNHGTGLQWNKDKPAATGNTTAGGAPAAPSAGAPPPPPGPPPPPAPAAPSAASGDSAEVDRSQLFAALNQGSGVTSGLKKVTDDMKTHKNPSLRNTGPVAAAKSSDALSPRPYSPPKFKKFNAPEVKKPPVFELKDKKWIIEYQEGNQNLVIDRTNDKQSVYMFKCKNSVLQVQGKINSIVLDNCTKCGVVFQDMISTVEFINCQSVKGQANGVVPTISVEKTDGCQIYLTDKSLGSQIVSAKSSEMNVCITKEDGDLNEFPLPEQYRSVWDGKKFVTTVMDLNS